MVEELVAQVALRIDSQLNSDPHSCARALNQSQPHDRDQMLSAVYNQLGNACFYIHKFHKALEYHKRVSSQLHTSLPFRLVPHS